MRISTITLLVLSLITAATARADHWVGTWGTAPQLVESNNNPPSPGLQNNSLRQIVQVSIGGDSVRLRLTNEFSTGSTIIQAAELSLALTAGSSSEIDEATTVSLTFDGKASVTMPAGATATSDPVWFPLSPRQNVAITLHYGQASSTSVSGHPGSRTTSYLHAGQTSDFTSATKVEHWYSILGLDVKASDHSASVAILGNSITDGRGSTTNQQNRWPDVLSRRMLEADSTRDVAVLNMGIGGNCVLSGGLGPTAKERWRRDLLQQPGVRWIILFEAVNDLGSARSGEGTALQIIELFKQIATEAHQQGIRVIGATITPFKGNSYYSSDHERGRHRLNEWIRTSELLDGVIDFDLAVRDPADTLSLQSQYLYENDHLHLNASGYQAMGDAIDLNLFTCNPSSPDAGDDTPQPEPEPESGEDDNDGGEHPTDVFSSNLPLIYIQTSSTINADAKVPGTMRVIDQGEGQRNHATDAPQWEGNIGIKLRGNSSLSFDQKKYTIETRDSLGDDLDVPLLGMPEGSDWVLLAPYNDISLVRDVFAFDMWTQMGHWGPRTRMCEVFVDGEYRGVYVCCESIKRGPQRVDIAKLKPEDIEGRELTGGYIVRVDAFDDDDATFQSEVPGLQSNMWGGSGTGTVTWTVYYPKKADLQPEQMDYIRQYVRQMEQSFQSAQFTDTLEGYAPWIHIPSFVDYFIHTEVSLNADGFKRSSYFYKDKDHADGRLHRMHAGPVWDYNLAYGNCNFCNANNPEAWVYEGCYTNPTPAFWKRLTSDPDFLRQVQDRYAELRRTLLSLERIDAFFDGYAALLDEAQQRHYALYDNLFSSGDSSNPWWWWGGGSTNPTAYYAAYFVESYAEEISTVKAWFRKRLAFLDRQWGYDPSASLSQLDSYFGIELQLLPDHRLRVISQEQPALLQIYSLSGHLLAASQSDTVLLPTMAYTLHQPLIVYCQTASGAYVSRQITLQ